MILVAVAADVISDDAAAWCCCCSLSPSFAIAIAILLVHCHPFPSLLPSITVHIYCHCHQHPLPLPSLLTVAITIAIAVNSRYHHWPSVTITIAINCPLSPYLSPPVLVALFFIDIHLCHQHDHCCCFCCWAAPCHSSSKLDTQQIPSRRLLDYDKNLYDIKPISFMDMCYPT